MTGATISPDGSRVVFAGVTKPRKDSMRFLKLISAMSALAIASACTTAAAPTGSLQRSATPLPPPTAPAPSAAPTELPPASTAAAATATAAPPTTSATPAAITAAPTGTAPARMVLSKPHNGEPGISVTLASGWMVDDHGRLYKGTEVNEMPEAMVMFWSFAPGTRFFVWGDPCRWQSTQPKKPALSVDEFAAALSAQKSRSATSPEDVTIGGYAGKSVTLHVPTDIVFDDCEGQGFQTYGTDEDPGARSQQGPGQIDQLWLTRVDGSTVVIDAMYRPDTSTELIDEMRGIAQSTTFDTSLPPGTTSHVLATNKDGAVGITVNVPASGWSGDSGSWTMEWGPDGFDPPAGAGIIAYVVDKEFYVYGDPCHWKNTRPKKPAATLDELVSALAKQASRDPSAPEDILTVDGYIGKKITLHVPTDAVLDACDEGNFSTFAVPVEEPALYAQGAGEIDEIWIVDVNGKIALIEGGYYAATPQAAVDDLHAILNSAVFD